jgi:hypothetical protein
MLPAYYQSRKRKQGPIPSSAMVKRPRFRQMAPRTYVRRPQRGEPKYVDANALTAFDGNGSTNASISSFGGIACGSALYQRIGRKATVKSLDFSYRIQPDILPAYASRMRVALVYDRAPTGVIPNYGDIFQSLSSTGAVVTDVESSVNLNNRDRFRILYNKMHITAQIDASAAGLAPGTVYRGNVDVSNLMNKRFIKCNLPVVFKSDADGLADISTGALYLVCFASSTSSSPGSWYAHVNIRTKYQDN